MNTNSQFLYNPLTLKKLAYFQTDNSIYTLPSFLLDQLSPDDFRDRFNWYKENGQYCTVKISFNKYIGNKGNFDNFGEYYNYWLNKFCNFINYDILADFESEDFYYKNINFCAPGCLMLHFSRLCDDWFGPWSSNDIESRVCKYRELIRIRIETFKAINGVYNGDDYMYHNKYSYDRDLYQLLMLGGDIESNPGPAATDYSNFASTHPDFYNIDIKERIIVESEVVFNWQVQINVVKIGISSMWNMNSSKKQAMELCYQDLMKIIRNNDYSKYRLKDTNVEKIQMTIDMLTDRLKHIKAVHESEMIEGSHGETSSVKLEALHTNLDVTTDASEGIPTNAMVSNQMKTTTEDIGKYDNLTAQWYLFDSFEWNALSPTVLRHYVLPRFILVNNISSNSPPLIPFNVNYLWRGHMEIRLETKAQMFLTGQLQVSSFYELGADADGDLRINPYTASQSNHVLINAGGSNDAVLKIPYVNHQPFVQTKISSTEINNSVLNMVDVLVQVLNPLKFGTGSARVDVAVFIRFIESEYNGKRDGALGNYPPTLRNGQRHIAVHESLLDAVTTGLNVVGKGVSIAENLLGQKHKDNNRDNPPNVDASPLLIPYSAQSWAHGTNITEPLRTLRLDPIGQTLHDDILENIQDLSQIVKIFGLFRQIEWSESQSPDTTLFKISCEPLLNMTEYQVSSISPEKQLCYIPPVGVIASMFNLFRGPLRFRLDIIANKFYTGGLIMGYIPGIDTDTAVTNDMIRNSAFTTYSLDANNLSITYTTPFINAAEWYNRRIPKPNAYTYSRKPGIFVINVLQRLQQPENVNNTIDINIYMAGGDGFECANLTQPTLVMSEDATPVPFGTAYTLARVTALDTTFIVNDGTGFPTGNNICLFYIDHGFNYATFNASPRFAGSNAFMCNFIPSPFIVLDRTIHYMAFLRIGGNLVGVIPDPAQINEMMEAMQIYDDSDASRAMLLPYYLNLVVSSVSPPTISTPVFSIIWAQGDPVAIHESERNEIPNEVNSVQHYTYNNWGSNSFGENFTSVKDLLRRPVYNSTFIFTDTPDNQYPRAIFKVKVSPVLPIPNLSDVFDIINRSSHSKILLSGYRYYRGGMRYRIVCPYLPGVFVWVQYDAGDKIAEDNQSFPLLTLVDTPTMSHSNPTDIITLSVNQVINLEIPWYNANQLNYLQRVDYGFLDYDQRISADMGSFMVGVNANSSTSIDGSYKFIVFSKVADDFSPYVFQGFKPMSFQQFLNPSNPPVLAVHEGPENFVSEQVNKRILEPIMLDVKKNIDIVGNDVREQIGSVTDVLGSVMNDIMDKIKKMGNISLDFSVKSALTDLMSQFGHCLINPSLRTLVWAIISILVKLGVLSFNLIGKAISLFNSICDSIFSAKERLISTQQVQGYEAVHEADDNLGNNVNAFWSLIVSSLTGILGLSFIKSDKHGKVIGKSLLEQLRTFTMTANSLTQFFKLHLDTIREIISSLCFWRNVADKDGDSLLIYNSTFISAWCKEVSFLSAPGKDMDIFCDLELMDRVYLAWMIGELISRSFINKLTNQTNIALLQRYLNKINDLHKQCVSQGKTGNVRKEPFSIWISGEPGCGKSYIVEHLTTELIRFNNIKFSGEKTFKYNSGDKFWSRCRAQPVLWIDDVFQINSEPEIVANIQVYFNVVNNTPLCPPMADIKDKDRLYEPKIVVTTSNQSFPNPKQCSSIEALWRRRDVLMETRINRMLPGWFEGATAADMGRIVGTHIFDNYAHLEFRFAHSVVNAHTAFSPWMSYEHMLESLRQYSDRYQQQSLLSYNHRLNEYYRALNRNIPDYSSLFNNIPENSNLYNIVSDLAAKIDAQTNDSSWLKLIHNDNSNFKIFSNISKRMTAFLCGIYPSFTYGVNSILNKQIPTKHGYETYKRHGLGWDTQHYNCELDSIPPAVVHNPPKHNLDFNPFSLDNKNIVNYSNNVRDYCSGINLETYGKAQQNILADRLEVLSKSEISNRNDFDDDSEYDSDAVHESDSSEDELEHLLSKYDRNSILAKCWKFILYIRKEIGEKYESFVKWLLEQCNILVHLVTDPIDTILELIKNRLSRILECPHYAISSLYIYDSDKDIFEVTGFVMSKVISGKKCQEHSCMLRCNSLVKFLFKLVRIMNKYPDYFEEQETIPNLEIENIWTFKNKCMVVLSKFSKILYDLCSNWWSIVIGGIGLLLGIWFLYYRNSNKKAESEGAAYDKNKMMRETRKLTSRRKLVISQEQPVAVPESGQNTEDIIRLIERNTLFLVVKYKIDGIDKRRSYRCMMLGDRDCLLVRHYIEEMQYYRDYHNGTISFVVNGVDVILDPSFVDKFYILENQEDVVDEKQETGYTLYCGLCVVKMPKIVPQFKNIIKHFVTSNEMSRMSSNGILIRIDHGNKTATRNLSHVQFFEKQKQIVGGNSICSQVILEESWMYRGDHTYGYCGSILINKDNNKIIGMHTYGIPNVQLSGSEKLIREEFAETEQQQMKIFQPNLEPIDINDRSMEGAVFPLGKVPQFYAKSESGKSQIIPSIIHGDFPVLTEPAPLTPYDPRLPTGCSPLYDGVAKHGYPPKEFPQDIVDIACKDLENLLLSKCIPVRPVSILSEKEAIFGNPDIGLTSLPMDTSEGFPLTSLRPPGCKGKGWLFQVQRENNEVISYELHPELRKIMSIKDQMRARGIKPFTVFTDCLKDETLPKAKCRKKGGTRIFSMSPVDFTIHTRQLLGDFILAYTACRRDLEHSIGINIYSPEWTELHREFCRKGPYHVAGDYSNFGPQAQSQVGHGVFEAIYAWYKFHGANEEHLLKIRIIAQELINSVHLVYNTIYQVLCGIVSGSLFTSIFNSLLNSVYLRVAWLMITGKSMMDWYTDVFLTTYGDDNNHSVTENSIGQYNVKTLHEFFKSHNMTYTDVHKNTPENMEPYCDIKDTTFLKCAWIPHPKKHGYFLAALDERSIENQLNWISKEGDLVENTKTNCVSALRQAYGHGEEYYNKLYSKIVNSLAKRGQHFVFKSWSDLYREIEGDYYVTPWDFV